MNLDLIRSGTDCGCIVIDSRFIRIWIRRIEVGSYKEGIGKSKLIVVEVGSSVIRVFKLSRNDKERIHWSSLVSRLRRSKWKFYDTYILGWWRMVIVVVL